MSIPSATSASAAHESLGSRNERLLARTSVARKWLSLLAMAVVFLSAIYLAGLCSGTAPEDFATITVPP